MSRLSPIPALPSRDETTLVRSAANLAALPPPTASDVWLLRLALFYLAGVPFITSLNGLSLWQLGISVVGPLYHTVFTAAIIGLAQLRPDLRRTTFTLLLGLIPLLLVVPLQLVVGYSDLTDLGQLYKYAMPAALFGALSNWRFLADPRAGRALLRMMRSVATTYALLIILSAVVFWTTGFEASPFPDGLRFTGFIFAYNGTVNALLLCGYTGFLLGRPALSKVALLLVGFYLIKSKAAVVYFGLVGWRVFRDVFAQVRRRASKEVAILVTAPIILLAAWVGVGQTLGAADVLLQRSAEGQGLTTDELQEVFVAGRLSWWEFMIADLPDWEPANLLIGNGFNVIRQGNSRAWHEGRIAGRFPNRTYDKTNKGFELDGLAQLDLFGLLGLAPFVLFFYVWPFTWRGLPYFRSYYVILVAASLLTGQVLNNPQVSTLLVFFLLHVRARSRMAAVAGRRLAASNATPRAGLAGGVA